MALKKKKSQDPQVYLQMLPPKLREGIVALGNDIDNDEVSREEWVERGVMLSQQAKMHPKAIQSALHQAIRLLADKERTERRAAGEEVPDAPKVPRHFF